MDRQAARQEEAPGNNGADHETESASDPAVSVTADKGDLLSVVVRPAEQEPQPDAETAREIIEAYEFSNGEQARIDKAREIAWRVAKGQATRRVHRAGKKKFTEDGDVTPEWQVFFDEEIAKRSQVWSERLVTHTDEESEEDRLERDQLQNDIAVLIALDQETYETAWELNQPEEKSWQERVKERGKKILGVFAVHHTVATDPEVKSQPAVDFKAAVEKVRPTAILERHRAARVEREARRKDEAGYDDMTPYEQGRYDEAYERKKGRRRLLIAAGAVALAGFGLYLKYRGAENPFENGGNTYSQDDVDDIRHGYEHEIDTKNDLIESLRDDNKELRNEIDSLQGNLQNNDGDSFDRGEYFNGHGGETVFTDRSTDKFLIQLNGYHVEQGDTVDDLGRRLLVLNGDPDPSKFEVDAVKDQLVPRLQELGFVDSRGWLSEGDIIRTK